MANIGERIPLNSILRGQYIVFDNNPNIYFVEEDYETLPYNDKYGSILSYRPTEFIEGETRSYPISDKFEHPAHLKRYEEDNGIKTKTIVTLVAKPAAGEGFYKG